MLETAITIAATAILAAMAAYAFSLLGSRIWEARAVTRALDAEHTLFRAKVDALLETAETERRRSALSWDGLRKFAVKTRCPESDGVCSFYLVPHDGKPLPSYDPGQYLTFQLNVPSRPRPVIRCYSLSDAPRPDHYRVTIKKIMPPEGSESLPPGLSSGFFHDEIEEGSILDVKAPSGGFRIDLHENQPVVLIGGGIGLTPVLSMLKAMASRGGDREIWMFAGMVDKSKHPLKQELETIARESPNITLHICYSDPSPDCRPGIDYHTRGRVTVDLIKTLLPSNNYQFYYCGPPAMMNALTTDLEAWGVPPEALHYEAFGPATVKKVAEATDSGTIPTPLPLVTFKRSAKTVMWDPSFTSLLDFAEANGVALESGCRAGNCGTCLTAVHEGEIDYTNLPGFSAEAGSCLTCVAQPKTSVTLDA